MTKAGESGQTSNSIRYNRVDQETRNINLCQVFKKKERKLLQHVISLLSSGAEAESLLVDPPEARR